MSTASATANRTLTINAAFLQEIKDDHRHLHDLRTALTALVSNPPVLNHHKKRFVTLLDEFRDQLAMHFSLEEAYGYFENALDVVPRLAADAGRLRDQHTGLFAMLMEIIDKAEDAQSRGFPSGKFNELVEQFKIFDAALSEHDAEEARLIFEAMHRDLGGEG